MATIDKSKSVEAAGRVTLRTALLDCIRELRLEGVSVTEWADRVWHAPEGVRQITVGEPDRGRAVRVSWRENAGGWTVRLAATPLTSKGAIPRNFLRVAKF